MGKRREEKRRTFFLLLFLFFPTFAQANNDVEQAGDIIQVLIPTTACGLTYAVNDKEGRNQFYKSFFSALGATYALKFTIDKKRPNGGSLSFPSGHTSAAFSGASFMQKRYGWKYGILAYMAASFVGWSRVETDNHYWEDVLAGAAIGTISSYCFTKPCKRTVITPIASNGIYGLTAQIEW